MKEILESSLKTWEEKIGNEPPKRPLREMIVMTLADWLAFSGIVVGLVVARSPYLS
jgi:hypothetical protein